MRKSAHLFTGVVVLCAHELKLDFRPPGDGRSSP